MKLDQQQQAQDLYFQTDLTKTEIAGSLAVSRRTIHYWVQQNNWERLKKNADHMPACLAENCYRILGDLIGSVLSADRIGKPATLQEVNCISKLTNTIHKLRSRSTLNESMELMKYFTESIEKDDPVLAEMIQPEINKYITGRAAAKPTRYVRERSAADKAKQDEEAKQDALDLLAWLEEERANKAITQPYPEPSPKKEDELNTMSSASSPAPVQCSQGQEHSSQIEAAHANQATHFTSPSPLERDVERSSTQIHTTHAPSPDPSEYPQEQERSSQAQNNPKPKIDLRKQLRGTATTGPSKNLRKTHPIAA